MQKQYNRFDNLDSLEERIIYHLFNDKGKSKDDIKKIEQLRRLVLYDDSYCLSRGNTPTWEDVRKAIDNTGTHQEGYRIYRYNYIEDAATRDGTRIKIYLDEILPENSFIGTVNVAIDIFTLSKNITVHNPIYDENKKPYNPTEEVPIVQYKNRVSMIAKLILQLVNGKDVAGIGPLDFSREGNKFVRAKMGLWNNRTDVGMRIIFSVKMGSLKEG